MTMNRRRFLKGLGVAMALPWLESLTAGEDGGGKKKPATKPPVRLCWVTVPNGVHHKSWRPLSIGGGVEGLSTCLQPLKPVFADSLVITDLAHKLAEANGDGAGDHARETATLLTGVQIRKTDGADIQCGISADQIAASRIGHLTQIPSLELGLDGAAKAGNCDSGYSCAYTSNISWRTATTPMSKETSPEAIFRRLFIDVRQGAPAKAEATDVMLRRSVLDLVREDASRLHDELGGTDRVKLEEYLDSVRSLEARIERFHLAGEDTAPTRKLPELKIPEGGPADHDQHAKLMFDLITLAWQGDLTRVCTLMLANGGSGRVYQNLGLTGSHHEYSHHGDDPEKIAAIEKIDQYRVGLFAGFVAKLKAAKDVNGGSLLDNCLVCYCGGLSDGNRHNHDDLPVILAGRGGGVVKTGKIISGSAPLNNLHLAMLAHAGAASDQLGDGTGILALPH